MVERIERISERIESIDSFDSFDEGDKVTDKATELLQALRGHDMPAQGNALGNGQKND